MISINTNLSALYAFRNLSNSTNKIEQAIERLSTGYKINHASDNAAGSSIATNLSTQISSLMQVQNNTEDGLNLLATAQGSLENIDSLLDRLRNLSMQAMNGTYDESSRSAMQKEADAIIEQIRYVRENTEFNGLKLFESMSSGSELIPLTTGESEPENAAPQNSPPRSMSSAPKRMAKSGAPMRGAEPIEGAFDVTGSATETVTIDGITYTFKNQNSTTNSVSYTKDLDTGAITFMCNNFTIRGQADVVHNIKIQGSYNYLYGGNLDDTLEVIKSTSYGNYLYGQDGDDTLINYTAGTSYLYGGAGNDTFEGCYYICYGEAGNDIFNATRGSASLQGGAGNDTFNITSNSNSIYGGVGADVINVSGNSNSLNGEGDEDAFYINSGKNNTVNGGAGTNSIVNNGTNTTLINVPGGTSLTSDSVSFAKNETKVININGIDYTITNRSSARDFVWEVENSGRINFKSTSFTIKGDENVAHNVKISGSSSYFYGGNLDDTIYVAGSSSSIYGKGGNDNITVAADSIYLSAGDGNDTINVNSGYGYYSTLLGGDGNDTLNYNGRHARSYVNMGAGDDTVSVVNGSMMVLDGGDGNDTFTGSSSNSLFYGFGESIDNTSGRLYLAGGETTDIEINGVTYTIAAYNSGYAAYLDYGYNEITGEVYFGGRYASVTGQSDASHNVKVYGLSMKFYGGDEADTITDYSNAGYIYGGAGNDTMTAYGNGGYVYGEDGDDTITLTSSATSSGGSGDDTFYINSAARSRATNGGSGNDVYYINNANAYLTDVEGDNVYYVNVNNGEFYGGTGNDTFYVVGNGNTVHGGLGDDYFIVDGNDNTVDGGTGNDYYVDNTTGTSGLLNVAVDPNSGILGFNAANQQKTLTIGGKTFTVTNTGASGSTSERNQLSYAYNTNTGVISFEGDGLTIEAPDGVNNIKLRGSDNLYNGGNSTDNIIIEQGSDNVINGGAGNDRIEMQSENNQISGDSGDDTIILKASTSYTVSGGAGNDSFDVKSSNNDISLDSGNNTISLSGSNNTISAGDGNNLVNISGTGNEFTAGNGNNDIRILSDSNTVSAGSGANKLGIGGNNNTVTLENVMDKVNINGNNNVVNIEQNNNNEISIRGDGNTYSSENGNRNVTVLGNNNNLELLDGSDKINITGNNNTLAAENGSDTMTVRGSNNNITTTSGKKKMTMHGDSNTYEGSSDADDISVSGDNNTINANGDDDKIIITKGSNNTVDGGDGVRNTIINNGTNTRAGNVVDITPRPFELGVKVDTGSDSNSFVNVSISFNLFDFSLDFMTQDADTLAENLDKIDSLRQSVSEQLVEIGGAINRLDYALESQSIKLDNYISSLSTIRDADVGRESAELIKYQILQQAAATLMSTANQSPAIALQLI